MEPQPQPTVNPASISINAFADIDQVTERRRNGMQGDTYYGHSETSFDIHARDPVFTRIDDPTLHQTSVLSIWNLGGKKDQKPWQIENSYTFVGFCGGDGFKFSDPTGNNQNIERANPAISVVVGGLVTIKWKGARINKGDYFYWSLKEITDQQLILPREKWNRIYADYKVYRPSLTMEIKNEMCQIALDDMAYKDTKNVQEPTPIEDGLMKLVDGFKTAFALGAFLCRYLDIEGTTKRMNPEELFEAFTNSTGIEKEVRALIFDQKNIYGLKGKNHRNRKNMIHEIFKGVLRSDWQIRRKIIGRAMSSGFTDDNVDVHIGTLSH